MRAEWGTIPANDDALGQWAALAAHHARAQAARFRALPPAEAARQITAQRAAAETARQAAAEQATRLRTEPEHRTTSRDPRSDTPRLGR